jgi:hypothetical protein
MKTILYHGSGFDQDELMPGFLRSGKLVQWDQTESNEWLYTTTDKQEAISQAFASMIEKTYESMGYATHGNRIEIQFPKEVAPSVEELKKLQLFLYTIRLEDEDGWVKNNNEHNQIKTEWKTQSIIDRNIIHKEQIDLAGWLANKQLDLRVGGKANNPNAAPGWLLW